MLGSSGMKRVLVCPDHRSRPASSPPGALRPAPRRSRPLPIVFVHGFSRIRRQQYETQALRWASNDYPNVVTGDRPHLA